VVNFQPEQVAVFTGIRNMDPYNHRCPVLNEAKTILSANISYWEYLLGNA
jgi:hypothetical protein